LLRVLRFTLSAQLAKHVTRLKHAQHQLTCWSYWTAACCCER